jgi:hypothetical protein
MSKWNCPVCGDGKLKLTGCKNGECSDCAKNKLPYCGEANLKYTCLNCRAELWPMNSEYEWERFIAANNPTRFTKKWGNVPPTWNGEVINTSPSYRRLVLV